MTAENYQHAGDGYPNNDWHPDTLTPLQEEVVQLRAKVLAYDTLGLVCYWHERFEFPPVADKPDVPDWDSFCSHELETCARLLSAIERRLKVASGYYPKPPMCLLYPQLMVSELKELLDAMAARDMVAALDACCDLRYVNDGTVRALGLVSVFYTAFGLVHVSNMSKLGPDGRPVKDETGKVQKGDWYKPVKLEHLIP